MIIGTGKLIEWFTINNKPFWIVRRSEKAEIITRSPEDDIELDTVKSKELLMQALSLLSPEIYYIQTWGGVDPKSTTGAKTCVHFRLTDPDARNTYNQQPVIAGIDPQTFESKLEAELQKRIEAFKKEQEQINRIGKLEEEIKQLKDDGGSGFWEKSERVMDRVERYIGLFVPGIKLGQSVGNIKQVNTDNVKEMNAESVNRIENAIAIFEADLGEEDTVALIEKLGAVCQNDNETFKFLVKSFKK